MVFGRSGIRAAAETAKELKKTLSTLQSYRLETMKLAEFPAEIARLEKHLLKQNQVVRQCQAEVDNLLADIDHSIAFDSELKNDAQRKAKRAELLREQVCVEASGQLQYELDNRSALETELSLVRNQFTVQKLLIRESIALRELQLADAA